MALDFLQIAVLIGALTLVVSSLYGQNVTAIFRQKGITTMCNKNALKNTRFYDADTGMTYICVSRQYDHASVYKCRLYPIGERHNEKTMDIDYSLLRGNVIEMVDKGTVTLTITRRENLSTVFAANNNVFDEAPEVLYDRLRRLETDNIRMEAEMVELKAMKHQDVKNVIDTAKSLEMAKGQGRGGIPR